MARRPRHRCAALALALVAVTGTASCGVGDIALTQDRRLHFAEPQEREQVRLPVHLRWHFDGTPPARYAVMVDQNPPPPGRTLAWYARRDTRCVAAQGCPDADYLSDLGVSSTTRPDLVLDAITKDRVRHGGSEQHLVTVILLDTRGRRIGESAWTRTFRLLRTAP